MKRILGRKIAHRRSMLRNLTTSLVLYEKVDTTLQKAKETKSIFEGIISDAKPADLKSYKKISSYLFDINASRKVRDELVKIQRSSQWFCETLSFAKQTW